MFDALTCSRNALLAALPGEDRARISPHLEFVSLVRGQFVYEPNIEQRFAYFPIDCVISLLFMLESGASDEIAMIGNEGMAGLDSLMGGSAPNRAVVRRGGYAWRVSSSFLRAEFRRARALQQRTLCFYQQLMMQIAQTAVCNRHHTVDQQLCRWLLMSLDRLPSNELRMTQEQISTMLGVRREGITEAAGRLQRVGVIRYCRGRIEVIDRARLENLACECYGVISRECARLQGRVPADMPVPTDTARHPQVAITVAA